MVWMTCFVKDKITNVNKIVNWPQSNSFKAIFFNHSGDSFTSTPVMVTPEYLGHALASSMITEIG